MSISLHAETRSNIILNAALCVFARYGFKRASMEDIAQEAGISRPALYLVYSNKGAIFNALAVAMAQHACAGAQAAWPIGIGFQQGLSDAGIALNLDAWRLIKGSPHGSELLSDNSDAVAEVTAGVDAFLVALVETRLREAGKESALARVIVSGLHGIKAKARSEDELLEGMRAFAGLIARAYDL
jgi:AcrR family transcriptional regulator